MVQRLTAPLGSLDKNRQRRFDPVLPDVLGDPPRTQAPLELSVLATGFWGDETLGIPVRA
jgi:hypothetical protein